LNEKHKSNERPHEPIGCVKSNRRINVLGGIVLLSKLRKG
jgi:hypothetical protein